MTAEPSVVSWVKEVGSDQQWQAVRDGQKGPGLSVHLAFTWPGSQLLLLTTLRWGRVVVTTGSRL